MPSELKRIKLLLDEHYPGWLAEKLTSDGIDTVALNAHRPELRGADDMTVLQAATAEGRVVVTEDVNTFGLAIRQVPDHVGVIFCHHARYPRTRPGLAVLHRALLALAIERPAGLGELPVEWWLPAFTEE
jgi:predicted nuclease of predicted toxin-antitoxin system